MITLDYITGPNGTDLKQLGYLGTDPGGGSFGVGINNSRIAVGVSSLLGAASSPRVLTLADRQRHLVTLQDYIINLPPGVNPGITSGAINDRNQIATSGSDKRCYIVCPTEGCK